MNTRYFNVPPNSLNSHLILGLASYSDIAEVMFSPLPRPMNRCKPLPAYST
ncbi:hypothetical protein ARTHRO9AX_220247 [Arthrobacter sp. 9AX]|nr:hypothetical protein ARTHRO9AX_220247 [Arthrobacter sp. 9AX]